MNLKLKSRLVERYRIQGAAARALGLSESRLSRLITGASQPTEREIKLLASVLDEDCFSGRSSIEEGPQQ